MHGTPGTIESLFCQGHDLLYDALNEEIENINPDIINFHCINNLGIGILDHVKTKSAKRVLTNHNRFLFCDHYTSFIDGEMKFCDMRDINKCQQCFPAMPSDAFKRKRKLAFKYIDNMDLVTVVGRNQFDLFQGVGVPQEKLTYIANGTDWPVASPEKERALGAPLRMIFIARNTEPKGLHILLEALSLLPEELKSPDKIYLDIVGTRNDEKDDNSTPERWSPENIEKRNRLLSELEPIITHHGQLPTPKVQALCRDADCLVAPSLFLESGPRVCLEAFASGCPVLCTNAGGLQDMVTDGVDGLYFRRGDPHDLRDKIMLLLKEPALLAKLKAGVRPPKTMEACVKDYIRVFEEVIRKPASN